MATVSTSIHSYIASVTSGANVWRTLRGVSVVRTAEGQAVYGVGNSAVIFKVIYDGRLHKLKCYIRPKRNLKAIYRNRFYNSELMVFDAMGRKVWTDIVLEEWREGDSLQECIEQSLAGERAMRTLAELFERLALWLLEQEWAHGDVKPDNIIVADGQMHLIDFDAMCAPPFEGSVCEELGTLNYQHPRRGATLGKEIDDYPIALIATALHALVLDATLAERYSIDDAILVSPTDALRGSDAALDELERLFARAGDALHYRMARLLRSASVALHGLHELLAFAVAERELRPSDTLTLDYRNGMWGFRCGEGWAIPPLYDEAFDFSEEVAAVRLCDVWHFIDTAGRVVFTCEGCEAVKPFRNGVAIKIRQGRRIAIDHNGCELP